MNSAAATVEAQSGARTNAAAYLDLTKPRVVAMILVTSLAGFYLGTTDRFDLSIALALMVGTAIAAGGTLALNQYFERDADAKMERTRMRPLPQNRLKPRQALIFGMTLTILGCATLALSVNLLTAAVTAAISVVYLLGYTPLKRITPFCTLVGAIPGALPPVAGWAAARASLDPQAWVLFAIMFLWQMPHSLAIAQLYRQDYARAGFQLLSVKDPSGVSTSRQILVNSFVLLAVATLPTVLGFAGTAYIIVAGLLGIALMVAAVRLIAAPAAAAAARRVVFASLVYLPVLLLVMVLDKV